MKKFLSFILAGAMILNICAFNGISVLADERMENLNAEERNTDDELSADQNSAEQSSEKITDEKLSDENSADDKAAAEKAADGKSSDENQSDELNDEELKDNDLSDADAKAANDISASAIVQIGNDGYETVDAFKTAFSALTGAAEVKLLADIDLGSSALTIKTGQDITLDLNGHALTSSGYQAINITGGDLTVNDAEEGGGKVTGTQRALICKNNTDTASDIVINGGTFTGTNYAVFANAGCNLTITGGEFNALSGSDSTPYAAVRIFCVGTFLISGGTFNGDTALRADYSTAILDEDGFEIGTANADVSVTGGVFNGKVYHNRGILNIYDGNFATNVNDYCVPGYRTKTMADGRFTIAPYADADPVAAIGSTTYQTVQEAIDAARSGDTIRLLESEKEQVTVPEDKNITLELNAFFISYPSGTIITNNGTLSIINSSEESAYVNTSTEAADSNICIVNNGTMVLGKTISLTGFLNIRNYGDLEYQAETYSSTIGLMAEAGSSTDIKGGILSGSYALRVRGGNVTIEDGSITSNYLAVYVLNCDTFTMTGGSLESYYGIGMLVTGGTVNISGGSIYGGGIYENPTSLDPNLSSGDALYILADIGTKNGVTHNINVNITGGTFISDEAHAVAARFTAETEHTAPVISISGGSFLSGEGETPVYVGNTEADNAFDGTVTVSSGIFSGEFDSSLLAEDSVFTDNTDEETKDEYPIAVLANAYSYVTFDVQDRCTAPAVQRIRTGETASVPTDSLTAENYTFTGEWYTDDSFTTLWNFDTDAVTENMTLFGKWVVADAYIQAALQKMSDEAASYKSVIDALNFLSEEKKAAYKEAIDAAFAEAKEAVQEAASGTTEDVDEAASAGIENMTQILYEAENGNLPVASDFVFTAPEGAKYDGSTQWSADLELSEQGIDKGYLLNSSELKKITLWYSADEKNWTEEAPVHAGTYYVKAEAALSTLTEGTITVTDPDWKFTVEKRSVTLTSNSVSKKYDGKALIGTSVTAGNDGFAKGEGADYVYTGKQTEVGSSENTFTYTLYENTAASDYEISCVYGTLTVEKADTPSQNGTNTPTPTPTTTAAPASSAGKAAATGDEAGNRMGLYAILLAASVSLAAGLLIRRRHE